MNEQRARPVVVCFGGLDPSGGAGVQADIESIAAAGAHAAPIVTALTEQDTRQVYGFQLVEASLLCAQAARVFADMAPAAIKVGMLGSVGNLSVIAELARQFDYLPLVVDPVLTADSGGPLSVGNLIDALRKELIPLTTLLTPNTQELLQLTGEQSHQQAATQLIDSGCRAVLVTGTHADTPAVINTLYQSDRPPLAQHWPRLPYSYHGSGCTLASAIAARLALGEALEAAVINAQAYTWESLNRASQPGKGQWIPARISPE